MPFSALPPRITHRQQAAVPFSGTSVQSVQGVLPTGSTPARILAVQPVQAIRDGEALTRKLRVAVIGGGPSGACAADTLAQGGIETYLIERKLDNCKVPPGT